MAGQSMIMGESFGKGFQYGKRKISSMTNEEFNAMDADDLGRDLATDYSKIIPHLEQAVRASSDFQQMIIQELIKIIPNFVDQLLGGGGGPNAPPGGSLGPPPGIPGFITPIIGPPPSTILQDPAINPPGVTQPGLNPVEKYASKWINPPNTNFNNITLTEIRYLINQRIAGNLFPKFKSLSQILLKKEKELMKKPSVDIPKVIGETSSGIVKTIALMFNNLKSILSTMGKIKKKSTHYNTLFKRFLKDAKEYNQFVAKNGKSGLQINTAKSIQSHTIVKK